MVTEHNPAKIISFEVYCQNFVQHMALAFSYLEIKHYSGFCFEFYIIANVYSKVTLTVDH